MVSEAPLLIMTALPPLTATMVPVFVEMKEPLADVRTHKQLVETGKKFRRQI
jgi:hypothetical protein